MAMGARRGRPIAAALVAGMLAAVAGAVVLVFQPAGAAALAGGGARPALRGPRRPRAARGVRRRTERGRGAVTQGTGQRAIIAAFLANLGIALLKFVGFVITGAASMLAESVHSVADTGNQGLLLIGGRRGRRGPTEEHPFGYGQERYFWAFLVAVVLFTLGSLFALFEGTQKLLDPHELESPPVAIAIL